MYLNSTPTYIKAIIMPLGIIQPSRTEKVPGTVLLFDENVEVTEVVRALKHGSGKVITTCSYCNPNTNDIKDSHTVLVPQPSDDPNDPLVCFKDGRIL